MEHIDVDIYLIIA